MSTSVEHPYRVYLGQRALNTMMPLRRRLVEAVVRFHLSGIFMGVYLALMPLVLYAILSPSLPGGVDEAFSYTVMVFWALGMGLALFVGWLRSLYDDYVNRRALNHTEDGYRLYRGFLAEVPQDQWPTTNRSDTYGELARYAGYGPFLRWMWRSNRFVWGVVICGALFVGAFILTFVVPALMPVYVRLVLVMGGLFGAVACMQVGAMRDSGRLYDAWEALGVHATWQDRYRHELTLPVQEELPVE